MDSVFVKVPVKPEHSGVQICFSDNGSRHYGYTHSPDGSDNFICEDYRYDGGDTFPVVTHVLIEVQLPTEEEIEETSTGWKEETKSECYKEGANFILNHIKKGGVNE